MGLISADVGNAAAIRAKLRRAVGYGTDTVLVTDALCDDAVLDALQALNTMRPAIGVGTFQTVADQQIYEPLPAGAYGLRNVFWPIDDLCSPQYSGLVDALDQQLGEPIDEQGTRTVLDPEVVAVLARRGAWLRRMLGGTVRVVDGTRAYLIPVPSTSGKTVIFTYHGPRYASAGAVGDLDARRFWAAAEAALHRALAVGAGAVASVSDTTEGTSIRFLGPEHHLAMAERRQAEFERLQLPPAMTSFP